MKHIKLSSVVHPWATEADIANCLRSDSSHHLLHATQGRDTTERIFASERIFAEVRAEVDSAAVRADFFLWLAGVES